MAKRTAAYQLTADNFDDQEEEEKEDGKIGEFSKASEDVMARRVIKKAKKRMDGSEASAGNPVNIFSGFKSSSKNIGSSSLDFGTSSKPPISSSIFASTGFGLPVQNKEASITPALLTKTDNNSNANSIPFNVGDQISEKIKPTSSLEYNTVKSNKDISDTGSQKENDAVYSDQIAALNMSFLNWINLHVEKNPVVDLTPVFKDYTKYMDEIELKYGKSSKLEENASSVVTTVKMGLDDKNIKPGPSSISSSLFDKKDAAKTGAVSSPFSADFSQSKTSDATKKANIAGFFSAAQTSTPSIPTIVSEFKADNKKMEESGEEDSNDSEGAGMNVVVEEDAFYTTRCKLFFKKADNWTEMGIGMLYLKSLSDGKTQLLIRMETAAGKVLLNIAVHKNLPVARVGKNNVSVISVPNPPVFLKEKDGDNTKPLNYLIRVKERHDADELLKKINDGI